MVFFPVSVISQHKRRVCDDGSDFDDLDCTPFFTKTNSEGKEVPDWTAISIVAGFFVCCAALVDFALFHNPLKNAYRSAKKQGIAQLLNDAHQHAEYVVVNNIQCVPVVSEKEARRDSARCVNDISEFIDRNNWQYVRVMGTTRGTFLNHYNCVLDLPYLYKSREFRAILAEYEKAVQRLIAARTAKQNNKLVGR